MSEGSAGNAGGSTGAGNAAGGGEGQSTATAQAQATSESTSEAQKTNQNVENSSESDTENKSEKQETKEYRKLLRDRIKKHFPDSDHEDNETFYKDAYSRYDKLSEYQKKNQAINKQMIDTFNSNPELAGLMRDIMKGAPIHIAIARNIDVTKLKPIEGDPDESEWAKALEENKKKLVDKEAYQNSLTENMNVSIGELKAFAKENNLDGEQAAEFLSQVDELVGDVIQGKLTKSTLSKLYRATTAEQEIANAAKAAEVKGRNAKIEAIKSEEKPNGDGIPTLQSTTEDQGDKKEEVMDGWNQAVMHQQKKRRI